VSPTKLSARIRFPCDIKGRSQLARDKLTA
jgi:hypothetical protein